VIDSLLSALYLLVKEEEKEITSRTGIGAGHAFEDTTAQKIYFHAKELGLRPNPPRYTLDYPTFSGNVHQFDASFRFGNITYVIECKKRKMAAKEHIYYFNSKVLDYVLGAKVRGESFPMKGIFLSTVEVGETSMIYAIAYGILVIDPASPPVEHMMSTLSEGSALWKALQDLKDKFQSLHVSDFDATGQRPAADLYNHYRFLSKRWMREA